MLAYAFAADGMEEVECLMVVDLLRRAGIDIRLVSINGTNSVTSSHRVTIQTDLRIEEADFDHADLLFLPGGIPGTPNLAAHPLVCQALKNQNAAGKRIAAICAAPTVLGGLGLLEGKIAVCYPGMEDGLVGAITDAQEWNGRKPKVVTVGNITTSRGLGTAMDLGLELIKLLISPQKAEEIAKKVVYEAY